MILQMIEKLSPLEVAFLKDIVTIHKQREKWATKKCVVFSSLFLNSLKKC